MHIAIIAPTVALAIIGLDWLTGAKADALWWQSFTPVEEIKKGRSQ